MDKRASMTAIGNLNDYVKYQMGVAMGQGGEAGAAAGGGDDRPGHCGGSVSSSPSDAGGTGAVCAAGSTTR